MTQEEDRRAGRDESEDERADRMWGELIQEVRVAQTGVQILFGFLLTVVFTPKYAQLEHANQVLYIVTVVSGRSVKPQAVRWASRLTFVGLVLLLATMTAALLLILRVATHDAYVPWLVAGVVSWYLLCWFVLPMWARHRHTTR
jgi:hypothetical protein